MKVLNSSDKGLPKYWIEIREDWHIYLDKIFPTKSLSQALFEFFLKITPCPWPIDHSFIQLECANCDNVTVYDDLKDIPFSAGDKGQLVCPKCQQAWLTYRYIGNE